jgi:FKBP-type peptidyl-prolyl cis-trans isomerase FkpA
MFSKFITFSLLLVIAASCTEDEVIDNGPADKITIENYLAANNLSAQSTSTGLYYIIHEPGGAIHPTVKSSLSVNYKGYLTNNSIFDSSYPVGKPADIPLKSVIKGWQEGVPFIGAGGKIQLFVPSALGYGSSATRTIPANSVLIFEIELVDFY